MVYISKKIDIPVWEKMNLTIEEAVAYSGIGENSIRDIVKQEVPSVLKIGNKKLIKRKKFEEWISDRYAI